MADPAWQPPEELRAIADLDLDRTQRRGYPEAIYCEGKTPDQLRTIAAALREKDARTIFTRADAERAAAILQAPFFDLAADPAVNYGAIGAVIGHEMGHGFDDQGAKFDASGHLRNWWTAEDEARFKARTKVLGEQYSAFEPLPSTSTKSSPVTAPSPSRLRIDTGVVPMSSTETRCEVRSIT